jgi:hypothetical protein
MARPAAARYTQMARFSPDAKAGTVINAAERQHWMEA